MVTVLTRSVYLACNTRQVSLEPLEDVLRQLRTDPVQVSRSNLRDDDDPDAVLLLLLNADWYCCAQGLSSAEVKLRREVHGMNVIEPPLSFPKWLCCLLPW